jgi:peptidyl-prolyl cis-trans isomerase C
MKLVLVAFVASLLSCSPESPPVTARDRLPPGIAASVGSDLVEARTIASIASAQRVDPAHARELAIRDALFAAAVRANPLHADSVTVAERAVLGRSLLEGMQRQALEVGAATDAEVSELTAERWTELDRPPSVRTTHAVLLVEKPADSAPARAVAERLAAALRGIAASAEFIERAQAFPAEPFKVKAERLSPVTPDGRIWDFGAPPGTHFPTIDLDYARAASALARPGDQSPIVKSAFGYHVILLEERLPEARPSLEERRALLRDEILSRRGKKLLEGTVARLRQGTPVEVVRAADSLTALVSLTP